MNSFFSPVALNVSFTPPAERVGIPFTSPAARAAIGGADIALVCQTVRTRTWEDMPVDSSVTCYPRTGPHDELSSHSFTILFQTVQQVLGIIYDFSAVILEKIRSKKRDIPTKRCHRYGISVTAIVDIQPHAGTKGIVHLQQNIVLFHSFCS